MLHALFDADNAVLEDVVDETGHGDIERFGKTVEAGYKVIADFRLIHVPPSLLGMPFSVCSQSCQVFFVAGAAETPYVGKLVIRPMQGVAAAAHRPERRVLDARGIVSEDDRLPLPLWRRPQLAPELDRLQVIGIVASAGQTRVAVRLDAHE
jgi:hypothetical protein